MAFYQPEGYFGPLCDPGSSARAEAGPPVEQVAVLDDPFVTIDPTDGRDRNFPAEVPSVLRTECKQRTLPDGSIEYYDCRSVTTVDDISDFNGTTCINNSGVCFNWEEESQAGFGIDDEFFVPRLGPDSCVPYRPDINIRPTIFTDGSGVNIKKYAVERSSPVTYPVDAFSEETDTMTVAFSDDGSQLIVGGAGGNVEFTLEWDDDTSNAGVALDSVSINGTTWTRSGESGRETKTISVIADTTYPVTFSNLNAANTPIRIQAANTTMCLKDGDGSDCNATFWISNYSSGSASGTNLWNENGTNYGVWTNPELCTLPCIPQEVTYTITFPATDTYYFEFGADDSGRFFIDDDPTPLLDINDGISSGGRYRDPWVASATVTQGIHKIIVQCTNRNSQFVSSDDNMRSVANVLLVRVDGTEERGDFGYRENTPFNYFTPIARAIADEYLSGRFGRTESTPGQYSSSGRPPEPSGMQTHVDYYVAAGGSVTDDPIDPTIWASTKTNSILVGWNLGENTAPLVQGVFYPSCAQGVRNGILEANLNPTAADWRYNPGGWYLKICRGGPCVAGNALDWVPITGISAWNTFMNDYAIWPEFDNPLVGTTQTITHVVTISESDTYTLQYACDNQMTLYWNSVQVATHSSFTSTGSYSFTAAPGVYKLRMDAVNVAHGGLTPDTWANNPAGGAWLLTNSNGDIISSSRVLNNSGSGNLFWHTRLATGYEYVEQIV